MPFFTKTFPLRSLCGLGKQNTLKSTDPKGFPSMEPQMFLGGRRLICALRFSQLAPLESALGRIAKSAARIR